MLATLVAGAAELLAAALWIWRTMQPDNQIVGAGFELFAFCAFVVGSVSLLLTWLVRRLRRVLPPRHVTAVALVVGVLPLVLAGLRLLF
jgi:hypothetical protein